MGNGTLHPDVLRIGRRDAFLMSSRALPVCAREFGRLGDDIAERIRSIGPEGQDPATPSHAADVRRSPSRCIAQLGPVALTLSWVRARVDTVADGRLLVIVWRGTVGRTGERALEHVPAASHTRATVIREEVLCADATMEADWVWRAEAAPGMEFRSPELAARCVESLMAALATAATAATAAEAAPIG